MNKIYNVGIYLRLSQEDQNVGQSESITNQRDYITRYVVEQNWNIVDVYIDDGWSGLNFERPDFKRMISDIEKRKIDLVITKDLSRLGRDYIQTGFYLEKYFPEKNVRYIALSDGIDTGDRYNSNNDMSPFKAILNDMYAKDISKKVRTTFNTKRANGQFIGAFAPYGYLKDNSNKNQLVIDYEAAPIVQRIFSQYLEGVSMGEIKRRLNEDNIKCPCAYKLNTCNYKNVNVYRYVWTQETVKRILTNPTYAGHMAQHRQEKINYKSDKFRKYKKDDWIIVENTHEPIINQEDFNTVQKLIQQKANHYANSKHDKTEHLLNGLLFCYDCHVKMTYRRNSSKKMVAMCMTYSKFGKTMCSSHLIQEQVLIDTVINELRSIAKEVLTDDFYNQFELVKAEENNAQKEIDTIEKRLVQIQVTIKSLYTDKLKGIIDEEIFVEMSKEYNDEKTMLSERKTELLRKINDSNSQNTDFTEDLRKIIEFETVDKTTLFNLIEKIEVTADRQIIIHYKFKNPYT